MLGGYRADPFTVLPTEIVIQVVKELAFRELWWGLAYISSDRVVLANSFLSSVLRVSRGWKSTLASLPELWKDIDLTVPSRTDVPADTIQSYFENANWNVYSVTIGSLSQTYAKSVLNMLRQCPNLKRLGIQAHAFRGPLTTEAIMGLDCERLTTLGISHDCYVAADSALEILQYFRNLERVQLTCTSPKGANYPPLPEVMPRLRSLRLNLENYTRGAAECLLPFIHEIPQRMPGLTELLLSGTIKLPTIFRGFSSMSNLRRFTFQPRTQQRISGFPSSLEYLKLDGVWDSFLINTLWSAPHLRGLYITPSRFGGGGSINQIVDFSENLQVVRISCCIFSLPAVHIYHTKLRSLKVVDLSVAFRLPIDWLTAWLSQTEARLSHLSLANSILDSPKAYSWIKLITCVDWTDLVELDLSALPSERPEYDPPSDLDLSRYFRRSKNIWRDCSLADEYVHKYSNSIGTVENLADLINTHMPNLEVLNLTGCGVGIATIKALINGNKGKLKKLIAVDCVLDDDFPELLRCGRGKGVKVYSVRYRSPSPYATPRQRRAYSSEQGCEQWGHVSPMRDLWEDDYSPFISLDRDIESVFF